jgi:hypothetical protein
MALGAVAFAGVGACSSADETSPGAASSCEELVKSAAQLTRTIVRDLQGKTVADLRAANPDAPYAELLQPFDAYRARAEKLGCDQGELRRLACKEYRGIQPNGPVSEEFLALVPDTSC